MSCILRVSGSDLDIDALLNECQIQAVSVSHKGQLRFPLSQPSGSVYLHSGANFEVSGADFSELHIQIADALEFLRENEALLSRLRSYPGVEELSLDFGTEISPPGWCWFSFPAELLVAIGLAGLKLILSVYPVQVSGE